MPTPAPSRPGASSTLVRDYEPLVRALVRRVAGSGLDPVVARELYACGMVGLVEASRRFDPSRSVAFSTFAFHRVRGAIRDGWRELRGAVATPDVDVDSLPDERGPRTDEAVAVRQALERLPAAWLQLSEPERFILAAHYRDELTFEATAARLGRSKSWVSRLHARAIDKLGRLLEHSEHALATRSDESLGAFGDAAP